MLLFTSSLSFYRIKFMFQFISCCGLAVVSIAFIGSMCVCVFELHAIYSYCCCLALCVVLHRAASSFFVFVAVTMTVVAFRMDSSRGFLLFRFIHWYVICNHSMHFACAYVVKFAVCAQTLLICTQNNIIMFEEDRGANLWATIFISKCSFVSNGETIRTWSILLNCIPITFFSLYWRFFLLPLSFIWSRKKKKLIQKSDEMAKGFVNRFHPNLLRELCCISNR